MKPPPPCPRCVRLGIHCDDPADHWIEWYDRPIECRLSSIREHHEQEARRMASSQRPDGWWSRIVRWWNHGT